MIIKEKYKGHTIKTANPTGGKAGKGHNKTSTVQVLDSENCLKKQVRYKLSGGRPALLEAFQKAKDWIDGKKPDLGGARPGSGPKVKLEGAEFRPTYLDIPTVEALRRFGNGNLSKGIRRSAIVLRFLETAGKLEEYRTLAMIEEKKGER